MSPSLPVHSLSTPQLIGTSSGVTAVEECLLSVVTCFTRFSSWPPDLTILDLGTDSFDVVRISAAVETHFSCRTPLLTHVLLTKTFRDVVSYLWVELNGTVCSDEEGEGYSLSQKREREERSLEPPPKRTTTEPRPHAEPHPAREPHPPSKPRPPSEPIRAWRRGQCFYNGL